MAKTKKLSILIRCKAEIETVKKAFGFLNPEFLEVKEVNPQNG